MTKLTCYHQNKRIVWTDVSNDGGPMGGPRQLRHQCTDCGRQLPGALPHSMASQDTPRVDYDALSRWIEHDREQWNQGRNDRYHIEQQRQAEWRDRYEKYLQSPEWKAKRRLVFKRCGGVCEGCGEIRATEVHHLTYEHLGNELLWELAAACRECHERVHENSIANTQRKQHIAEIVSRGPILRDVS